MAYSPEDLRKLSNISVSTPSGFETEYKSNDFHMSEKEAIAYAQEMGASDSIRGLKQIYGNITNQTDLLEALEKKDKKLKTIFKNPEFGNKAFQNYLGYAVVADPVGYIPLIGWAKKSKSLFDATKYGVGMGGAYGAMAYVGEGESRALNSTVGATAGGLLGLGSGALLNKVNKSLNQTPLMPSVNDSKELNLMRRVDQARKDKTKTVVEIEESTNKALDEIKEVPNKSIENKLEVFYTDIGGNKLWDTAVKNWGTGLVSVAAGVGGYNAFNDPESTQAQKITAGLLFALGGGAGSKALGKMSYKDSTVSEMFSKGIIDNYGLPKNYVELVQESFGEVNKLSNRFIEIVNKSSRLSMDERQVLYNMITGELKNTPDLIGFKKEARDIMTETGKAMVDAGLLSEKVFVKNVDKYIHRSYMKHVIGKDGNPEAYNSARKLRIVGDELKPRGKELPNSILKTTYNRSLDKNSKNFGVYEDYDVINIRTSLSEAQYKKFNTKLTTGKTFNFNKDIKDIRDWKVKGQGADGRYILEDTKRIKLRRDLTKEERLTLGEIEDASFAIAETGRLMTNDLSIYKLYENISKDKTLTKTLEEYKEAINSKLINEDDWIQVSGDSLKSLAKVDGNYIRKYGKLANQFVPKEVFEDLTRINTLKEGDGAIMEKYLGLNRLWKKSKTAWNPVVHVNNTVSNIILYDLAGANYKFMGKGFSELRKGIENSEGSEIYNLAKSFGVFDVDIVSRELTEQTGDALQDVMNKLGNPRESEISSASNYATKAYNKLGKLGDKTFGKLTDLYQLEDQAFRMGLFMDRINKGMKPAEAAADAKKWFIDYNINAPWINTMRRFPTPFLSYTYRVIPLLGEAAIKRPWKFAKWSLLGYGLNEVGTKMGPGNEEEERLLMREQYKQKLFGMPFLSKTTIKTPFTSGKESLEGEEKPLYIDVKRFIPGGDVFAIGEKGLGVPIPFTDKSLKLPSTLAPNFGALGEIFIPMIAGVDPFTFRKLEGLGLGNDDTVKWNHVLSRLLPNVPTSAFTVPMMSTIKGEGYTPYKEGDRTAADSPIEKNPFAQSFGSKKIRNAYRQAVSQQEATYSTNFTPFESILSVFGFKLQPMDVSQLLGIKGSEFRRKYSATRQQFYRISARINENKISKEEGEKQINKLVKSLEKEHARIIKLEEELKKVREKKTKGGFIEGPEVPQTKLNPARRINPITGLAYKEERITLYKGGDVELYTPLENELYQIQLQAESNLPAQNLYSGIKRKKFNEGTKDGPVQTENNTVVSFTSNYITQPEKQYKNNDINDEYLGDAKVNKTPNLFLQDMYQEAVKAGVKHPGLIAAQAAVESRYGMSKIAQETNNTFGVKVREGENFEGKLMPTKEDYGQGMVDEVSNFRKYNSVQENILGMQNFIKSGKNNDGSLRYEKALQAEKPLEYLQEISKAGYATDPSYYNLVEKVYLKAKVDKLFD